MNWLSEIHFSEPLWFYSLPVMFVFLILVVYKRKQTLPPLAGWLSYFTHEVYRHPLAELFEKDSKQTNTGSHHFYSISSYLLISSLLIISLAQPYQVGKKLPDPPRHRDIVFLVDTSVSMILRDYLVNGKRTQRITVLKNVLTHFVEQLKGNRIQLIAYSENAYTMVPLTTDYSLVKYQLQRLEAASLTGRSSNLSKALLYALKDYTLSKSTDTNKPVFIMLTDAHRPVRNIDPGVAAQYIAQHGIRLHTIAIGAGSYAAEDKDKTSLVYHPTSFYLLEQVAKSGMGKFFWAKDSASLAKALATINEVEKRSGQAEPRYILHPLYMWPLLAGLIGLAITYLTRGWLR